MVSQLFTNSLANTPPSLGRGQTPPLPTHSSWRLVRESRPPGPGLEATRRGRAGGQDGHDPGARGCGALNPHTGPRGLSRGPVWTGGKVSDHLSLGRITKRGRECNLPSCLPLGLKSTDVIAALWPLKYRSRTGSSWEESRRVVKAGAAVGRGRRGVSAAASAGARLGNRHTGAGPAEPEGPAPAPARTPTRRGRAPAARAELAPTARAAPQSRAPARGHRDGSSECTFPGPGAGATGARRGPGSGAFANPPGDSDAGAPLEPSENSGGHGAARAPSRAPGRREERPGSGQVAPGSPARDPGIPQSGE